MRFGVKAVAAAMALMWALPASALTIVIQPTEGPSFVSGTSLECGFRLGQSDCVRVPVVIFAPLTPLQVDVASLDGEYSFGPINQSSTGSSYDINAFVRFSQGSLINALVSFRYSGVSPTVNGFNTSTTASGLYLNNAVYIPNTGQLLAPVPELSTWAMMLFGFSAIGLAMRHFRIRKPTAAYLSRLTRVLNVS